MDLSEIQARQDEIDRFADWLSDHDPRDFMQYQHDRGIELDALRQGDATAK